MKSVKDLLEEAKQIATPEGQKSVQPKSQVSSKRDKKCSTHGKHGNIPSGSIIYFIVF